MTLAPVTPTKNAIMVASTGPTAQVISSSGQVISGNQIVVTNANLAQQLASGKAQLTTIGGHQVVIRSTPTGGQIVLNSTNSGIIVKGAITPNKQQQSKFVLRTVLNIFEKQITSLIFYTFIIKYIQLYFIINMQVFFGEMTMNLYFQSCKPRKPL